MKTKDKIGHSIVNGHIIHECKDDWCIICFENDIKQRIIKIINHSQEESNPMKTLKEWDSMILVHTYGTLEKLKERIKRRNKNDRN